MRERALERIDRRRVGSFALGSVDIHLQLPNFEQTAISAAAKTAKTFFPYFTHASANFLENQYFWNLWQN
jgi:hypothetical protein